MSAVAQPGRVAFDHLMVAVADLDAAVARYRQLGFEVHPGGEHEQVGTANAIVPFADTRYVELIEIRDAEAAAARLPDGSRFVRLTEAHDEVPLIFVLASAQLESVRAGLETAGLETAGPVRLERRTEQDEVVGFDILLPGAGPWRSGFPSFIDWGTAAHPAPAAAAHANGARELVGIDVVVDDVVPHVRHYRALGLAVDVDDKHDRAVVELDGLRLALEGPGAGEAVGRELAARGPGVVAVALRGSRSAEVAASARRPFGLRIEEAA